MTRRRTAYRVVLAVVLVATTVFLLAGCAAPAQAPEQMPTPNPAQQPQADPTAPTGEASTTPQGSADGAKAEQIIDAKCSGCHQVTVVLSNPARDKATWERIISQMKARGASLTPEEQAAVIDYLVSRP